MTITNKHVFLKIKIRLKIVSEMDAMMIKQPQNLVYVLVFKKRI